MGQYHLFILERVTGIWRSKIEGVHQVHHKIQPTCLIIRIHPILGYGIERLVEAPHS